MCLNLYLWNHHNLRPHAQPSSLSLGTELGNQQMEANIAAKLTTKEGKRVDTSSISLSVVIFCSLLWVDQNIKEGSACLAIVFRGDMRNNQAGGC